MGQFCVYVTRRWAVLVEGIEPSRPKHQIYSLNPIHTGLHKRGRHVYRRDPYL